MRVSVAFHTVTVLVPCGDGECTVGELIEKAIVRFKKCTNKVQLGGMQGEDVLRVCACAGSEMWASLQKGSNEVVLTKPGEAPANRSPPPFPAPQPAEHEIKVKNLRMANGSGYIYNYDTVRDVLDDKELVRGDALGVDSAGKALKNVCSVPCNVLASCVLAEAVFSVSCSSLSLCRERDGHW